MSNRKNSIGGWIAIALALLIPSVVLGIEANVGDTSRMDFSGAVYGPVIILPTPATAPTAAGYAVFDTVTKRIRLGNGSKASYVDDDGINARDYLACNGTTDDRAAFASLIQSGGAASGKKLKIPDGCTVLISSPGGGSAAATLESYTTIECVGTGKFKLAGKECSAGPFLGAYCVTTGANTSECGSPSGYCTDYGQFAPTASTAYTFLKAANNSQNISIIGCTIDVNGMEPWNRCSGGTSANKPCKQVCTGNTQQGCTADSDCSGWSLGSCDDEATCSTGGGNCTLKPSTPSGPGEISVIDLSLGESNRIDRINIMNHRQGAVAVDIGNQSRNEVMGYNGLESFWVTGGGGVITNSTLNGLGPHWPQSTSSLGSNKTLTDSDVDKGIIVRGGSFVSNNEFSGSVYGIDILPDRRLSGIAYNGNNLITSNRVRGTKNFASAFYLESTQNVISNNFAIAWNCLDSNGATSNNTFTSNRCLNGAGPKVVLGDGGIHVESNYLAWGSGAYCTDATATNYGGYCKCLTRQCSTVGSGVLVGTNCDADADCGSGGVCASATAQSNYPCYDTNIDGDSSVYCDATSSKAKCENFGNVIQILKRPSTATHSAVAHSRIVNNIIFSSALHTPLIKVVPTGGYCTGTTAVNATKSCSCGPKQCAGTTTTPDKNCDDSSDCSGAAPTCVSDTSYPCYDTDADTTQSPAWSCDTSANYSLSQCSLPSVSDVEISGNTLLGQVTSSEDTGIAIGSPDATTGTALPVSVANMNITGNIFSGLTNGIVMPSILTDIVGLSVVANNLGDTTTPVVSNTRGMAGFHGNTVRSFVEDGETSLFTNKTSGSATISACAAVMADTSTSKSVVTATAAGQLKFLGTARADILTNAAGPVTTSGPGCCLLGGTVAIGDRLKIHSTAGQLVTAGATDTSVATALESGSASGTISCVVQPAVTPPAVGGSVVVTGVTTSPTTNQTRYLQPGTTVNAPATGSFSNAVLAYFTGGVISAMRCECNTAPGGASKTRAFSLVCSGNGSVCTSGGSTETTTALGNGGCDIVNTATTCIDTDDVTVPSGGTTYSIKMVTTNTPAGSDCGCTLSYTPTGF